MYVFINIYRLFWPQRLCHGPQWSKYIMKGNKALQAYCLTLEEEQARLTKDFQKLQTTVTQQSDRIHWLLGILAKQALHQRTKWHQFHIQDPDVRGEFRRVAKAVLSDLEAMDLDIGINEQLQDVEAFSCGIVQYDEGLLLNVHRHHFTDLTVSHTEIRQSFPMLQYEISGHTWIAGYMSPHSRETDRVQMRRNFVGSVTLDSHCKTAEL